VACFLFELTSLPAASGAGERKDSSLDGKTGSGQSAVFVARNRFAVLNKPGQVRISLRLIAYAL
jgi:coatomer protein complex subunit alpha (xenin)